MGAGFTPHVCKSSMVNMILRVFGICQGLEQLSDFPFGWTGSRYCLESSPCFVVYSPKLFRDKSLRQVCSVRISLFAGSLDVAFKC